MREIARGVGLQPGALYYYFASKDDLLLACQTWSLDRLIDRAEAIRAEEAGPAERLEALILSHLDLTLRVTGGGAAHIEVGALPPRHRRGIVRRRDAYEALVRETIEDGIQDGVFAPVDARAAALALLGALNWTAVWWRPGGDWSSENVAGDFAGIFLHGLMRRGSEEINE